MKAYMSYRTSSIPFYDCNGKIIFVRDEIRAKMCKTTYSDHDSSKTILPVVGSFLGQTMC